jgi:hypothetical protein
VLPAFAQQFDLASIDIHVHHPEREDFRYPSTRVEKEQKKQVISLAGPSSVRGGQNGLDFLRAEKGDQTVGVPFEWDARDPSHRRGEVRAEPVAQIMDKGADGCQTCIPSPDAIAALPLQVLKKADHGIRGKNVERQREAGPGVTFPEVLE